MTVPVGYRPDRIQSLDWQTRRAIDDLRRLHSGDPAAAAAIGSITAAIRLLEDHWMPLLAAIRTSQAMIDWRRAALGGTVATSDDELLAALFALNQGWSIGSRWFGDPDLGHDDPEALTSLTRELEARVQSDPAFAELLIDTAGDLDTLLLVLSRGTFPIHLLVEAVRIVIDRPGGAGPEHLRRALLIDGLLVRVAETPQAALDLLGDAEITARVVAFDRGVDLWSDRPVTPGVTSLLHAAMVEAPEAEPARRSEGFQVFSWFIDEANELPVDRDGFSPGVAGGLAASMLHYVPTFLHSISGDESTGALADSTIHADRTGNGQDDALSSYEEMTDFFGALLADAGAVAHLGVVLAAVADDVAYERTTLSEAAHFAGLLRDATLNEGLETAIAAAARSAQRGQIIDALAAVAKAATGVGGAAKATFDATTKFVTHVTNAADGGNGDDGTAPLDPGSLTRHLVQMSTIRRLAVDSLHRRDLGITSSQEAWSDVAMRLDELDHAAARSASPETLRTARQRIFNRVRELGGGAAIDRLDQHGTLAGVPNRDVVGD